MSYMITFTATVLFFGLVGWLFKEEFRTLWALKKVKGCLDWTWDYNRCVRTVSGNYLTEPFPPDWEEWVREDLVEFIDENTWEILGPQDPEKLLDLIMESGEGMYNVLEEECERVDGKAG